MPCRCDHMEPNKRELESKRVAELLAWVYSIPKNFPKTPVEKYIKASKSTYGNVHLVDEMTAELCKMCHQLDDSIIYDGRNPMARKLADWWDEHQILDEKRRHREAIKAARTKFRKEYERRAAIMRKQVLSEMSPEERKLIKLGETNE